MHISIIWHHDKCVLYQYEMTPFNSGNISYFKFFIFQLSWLVLHGKYISISLLWTDLCLYAAAAAAAKSLQSCPALCDPIDGSPPGSSVPGILQARTLEWVAISFSKAWEWKVKVKRPHDQQPTRLLRPWDFLGKSTGVGCHCLLCYVFICKAILLLFGFFFFVDIIHSNCVFSAKLKNLVFSWCV